MRINSYTHNSTFSLKTCVASVMNREKVSRSTR